MNVCRRSYVAHRNIPRTRMIHVTLLQSLTTYQTLLVVGFFLRPPHVPFGGVNVRRGRQTCVKSFPQGRKRPSKLTTVFNQFVAWEDVDRPSVCRQRFVRDDTRKASRVFLLLPFVCVCVCVCFASSGACPQLERSSSGRRTRLGVWRENRRREYTRGECGGFQQRWLRCVRPTCSVNYFSACVCTSYPLVLRTIDVFLVSHTTVV